jgi:hypothetical protein
MESEFCAPALVVVFGEKPFVPLSPTVFIGGNRRAERLIVDFGDRK